MFGSIALSSVSLVWDQWSVFGSIVLSSGESGLGSVECVRVNSAVVGESGLGSVECVRFNSAVVGESDLRSAECVRFNSAVVVSLVWDQWSVFVSIVLSSVSLV